MQSTISELQLDALSSGPRNRDGMKKIVFDCAKLWRLSVRDFKTIQMSVGGVQVDLPLFLANMEFGLLKIHALATATLRQYTGSLDLISTGFCKHRHTLRAAIYF